MKSTVLETQSADNLNMQIRLGIPHPVVSFARYTLAANLRSPFSSSIAPFAITGVLPSPLHRPTCLLKGKPRVYSSPPFTCHT